MPLVSIIIPAYNAADYILQTLDSVLAQTVQDFEIIVINDGSKDSTADILDTISQTEPRINVVHKQNSGVADTRNKGLEIAQGEYIAFLDADDIWLSNKLQVQIDAMRSVDANWSITNCDTIDIKGNILEKSLSKPPLSIPHLDELITWTSPSFVGVMSSLVMRRSMLGDIRFNPSISSPADRDFVIRLARKSDALYIPDSLWRYRILANSMSRNRSKVANDMIAMYADYSDDFYSSKKLKYQALARIYFICYRTYFRELKIRKGCVALYKYISYTTLNYCRK